MAPTSQSSPATSRAKLFVLLAAVTSLVLSTIEMSTAITQLALSVLVCLVAAIGMAYVCTRCSGALLPLPLVSACMFLVAIFLSASEILDVLHYIQPSLTH